MTFSWLIHVNDMTQIRTVALLRQVCRWWKKVVDGTPILWNRLDNGPLELGIAKSGNLPLTIIEGDIHGYSIFSQVPRMVLVRSAADRIKSLTLIRLTSDGFACLLQDGPRSMTFGSLERLTLIKVGITKSQWCRLIKACTALKHLCVHDPTFPYPLKSMRRLELSEHTAVHLTFGEPLVLGYGPHFGMVWEELRSVRLDVDVSFMTPRYHQGAIDWATYWGDRRLLESGEPLFIESQVTLIAPSQPMGREACPTSVLRMTCRDDQSLIFSLRTYDKLIGGIPVHNWPSIPTLTNPPHGTTDLIIQPSHRREMRHLDVNALLRSTKPTSVTICDCAVPLEPSERGNWLMWLDLARRLKVGWRSVSKLSCTYEDEETFTWFQNQVRRARKRSRHQNTGSAGQAN